MDVEVLVGEARERELQPMPARERIVAGATAIAFLCAAGVAAAVIPPNRSFEPLTCIGLVALLCVARRVTFEIGNNFATSDQLAFIPMLFLAPIEVVPLLAACGYILARLPDFVRGQAHTDRWLYTLGDAWHSIGAVVVLVAAEGQIEVN